jgi:hypothetical protein
VPRPTDLNIYGLFDLGLEPILGQMVSSLEILRILSYNYMEAILASRTLEFEESALDLCMLLKWLGKSDLAMAPLIGWAYQPCLAHHHLASHAYDTFSVLQTLIMVIFTNQFEDVYRPGL